MEIRLIDEIPSTHNFLTNAVRNGDITTPLAIYAKKQTAGVGSRGNDWIGQEGNLFLTFCIEFESLPKDLPSASTSIYFSTLMLEILKTHGSLAWLKWPNDFYVGDKKIGGLITTKINDFMVVSIGVNLIQTSNKFCVLDINITATDLVNEFIPSLKNFPSWKHIFSKYKLEFHLSQNFFAHVDGKKVHLSKALLCDDGSIEIEKKKVYSLR
ncbi:MAG: biotin--[acetyl-CoA-carboxylase] ligase [Campylobacteraceae bacterium]